MLKFNGASRLSLFARNENSLESYTSRTWPLALTLLAASSMAHAQTAAPEQQMQEVVVSASGFEQQIKEAPASITVISREELATKRVSSIAEALSDVEGIDVGDAPGKTGGMEIKMRGMPSKFTLILIDGRRQNPAGSVTPNGFGETGTSFMPPPAAIERIEVIRGPMATLYGSDAMGGVINIITRKVGTTWTGSATVEGTIHENREYGDSQAVGLYLSGPIKKDMLGLQVRARKYHRDASDIDWVGKGTGTRPTLTLGANPVKADINTVGARLSLTPNKDHELYLDIDQVRQRYDNSKGNLGTLDTPTNASGYGPDQRYNRDQITLAHTWKLGNGQLESSFMRNQTETIGRTIPTAMANAGLTSAPAGSPRTLESTSTIVDSKYVTAIGNNMLTVGGQWWESDMTDAIAPNKFTQRQAGIFAENEWKIQPNLALTVGIRHDDHSKFGGATNPRMYLVWGATDNWTIKGGVSKAYRAPNVEQLVNGLSGVGGQGGNPLYGNPDLKPEHSRTSEIGFYFDDLKGVRANATIFHTDFKDAISNVDFTPPGGAAGTRPMNIERATIKGVEIAASKQFNDFWKISGNYTYTDSEQKSGESIGQPLSNTPEHVINARIDWKAMEKLNLWARASYNSERYRSPGTNAAGILTKQMLGNYKSYSLVHIGGNYAVNKSLTFNMAINNLFDKDFARYHYITGTTYANEYIGNFERRRLWISANYTF